MTARATARSYGTPAAMVARRAPTTLYKAAACVLRAHVTNGSVEKVARDLYGKDDQLELVLRATTTPATLTNSQWAGVLAHDVIASQLIQKITALSAAASLMEAGLKINLAGVGSITIPGRSYDSTGHAAGDWIAEGAAIPLRQPMLAPGPKLVARKLGVLATFTAEMVASDSIEEFTTQAIREAAATVLDKKMFSSDAASAAAPPGILGGATTVTASAASAAWAISSDIGALVEALAAHGGGLEPVLIAAPAQAAALRMWKQDDFYDVYASLALAAGTVVAVEASSFVSGLEGVPVFSAATGATLHFEDTAPGDVTTSTPVKSLFQTDLIGLKMILRASWGMRNPAHVAIVQGVSW